jgi:ribosome-associated protein
MEITPDLSIDEREIEERFVRSSGPGGQNVNKVATAVELRFDFAGSALPDAIKARLAAVAGNRITSEGFLLIDSREHRTQALNREAARARLRALLLQAATPPRRRRKTRPTAGSRKKRLDTKRKRAEVKARRRTPAED